MAGLFPVVSISQMFSGFFSVMPYVRAGFKGSRFDQGYPELYPGYRQLDSGEVIVRAYAKPPATREVADFELRPGGVTALCDNHGGRMGCLDR